jgi:hypothetical protein
MLGGGGSLGELIEADDVAGADIRKSSTRNNMVAKAEHTQGAQSLVNPIGHGLVGFAGGRVSAVRVVMHDDAHLGRGKGGSPGDVPAADRCLGLPTAGHLVDADQAVAAV